MTNLPTPEESARLILAIFRYNNIQTDRFLEAGALNSQFIDADGSPADYEAGMKFAIEHGWIRIEPNVVRLNASGFD
jgi:hypothetical protein